MDLHVLQENASYCVPACVVMAQVWRGNRPADLRLEQRVLFEQLSVGGLCSLDAAAKIVPNRGCGEPDIDDAERLPYLAACIKRGQRAIVTCWPGELGAVLEPRQLSSPHGALPTGRGPHHSIFVFAARQESFSVYDPWHRVHGQPLELSWDEMARVWTGMMLLVSL